jgi:hypothetical protein
MKLKILEKLKEKHGGSTLFEIVISLGLFTFILFYPIATFTLTHKENLLEDVLTTSMQMISVEGGLTDRVQNITFENLEAKGLIPPGKSTDPAVRRAITISSNADARNGNTSALKYRDDADPKISIEIRYPADSEVKFINGLSKMIGANEANLPFRVANGTQVQWFYSLKGYILSEKINY